MFNLNPWRTTSQMEAEYSLGRISPMFTGTEELTHSLPSSANHLPLISHGLAVIGSLYIQCELYLKPVVSYYDHPRCRSHLSATTTKPSSPNHPTQRGRTASRSTAHLRAGHGWKARNRGGKPSTQQNTIASEAPWFMSFATRTL